MGAESAARAKADAQLDIEGFQHVLDNSAIGHVHKRHGPGMERRAGQVPVERSDFERLPAIVQSPDKITVERRPDNLDTIVIEKRINGVVYVVEEVRTGRRKLALKTMYKKLADTGAVPGSADAAVDLYVRNDPGRPPDDIIARPQIIDLNLPGTTYGRYSLAYKHGISGSDAEAAKYVSEALTGDATRQVRDRLGAAGGPATACRPNWPRSWPRKPGARSPSFSRPGPIDRAGPRGPWPPWPTRGTLLPPRRPTSPRTPSAIDPGPPLIRSDAIRAKPRSRAHGEQGGRS
ncbi:MAG: hypothetical protein DCC65_14940 [Planctomycetota bacterium]|nr:MAG: hypothetical protein DCC65_14940 [Planctomycetota bacterium]